MSLRVDTTPLITSSLIVGDTGHGVLGSEVPADGLDGPGYAYDQVNGVYDANEVRGLITELPSAGTLTANEDTSFLFTGAPDGAYQFKYQLYVDGVLTGSEQTVPLYVGVPGFNVAWARQSTQVL